MAATAEPPSACPICAAEFRFTPVPVRGCRPVSSPILAFTGPGLAPLQFGSKAVSENETLTVNQLPSHTHPMQASSEAASSPNPPDQVLAESITDRVYRPNTAPDVNMASSSVSTIGGSRSHTNLMPLLCVHFIIALFGIYPSRN